MAREVDVDEVAESLLAGVASLVRRVRQLPAEGDLTLPERAALSRLDRGGPATSADLAREVQISPQSMGATLAGLASRGLVERRGDPADGRRVVLSVTADGVALLQATRDTRSRLLARALAGEFTGSELEQLRTAVGLLDRLSRTI